MRRETRESLGGTALYCTDDTSACRKGCGFDVPSGALNLKIVLFSGVSIEKRSRSSASIACTVIEGVSV